jgi:hypothetical protein
VLWGLDPSSGNFQDKHLVLTRDKLTLVQKLFGKGGEHNVQHMLLTELEKLHEGVAQELYVFQHDLQSDREREKRLLFLFQKDLMPGISGTILESKDRRDNVIPTGVSSSAKMLSRILLVVLNVSMLFYVLLFAVSQDVHRQTAWAKSFGMWFITEVLVVSSFTVCFMHVFIPSITMGDVSKIRTKLMQSVASYRATVHKTRPADVFRGEEEKDVQSLDGTKPFNSASYLFLSHRMASLFPELRVSRIVLAFSTPWPRQSYQHVSDMSKQYNKKFSAVSRSASILVMFFLSRFLTIPQPLQDLALQCSSTAVAGYAIVVHMRLYRLYPVLVLIPTLVLGSVVYVVTRSSSIRSQWGGNNGEVHPVAASIIDKRVAPAKNVLTGTGTMSGAVEPTGRDGIRRRLEDFDDDDDSLSVSDDDNDDELSRSSGSDTAGHVSLADYFPSPPLAARGHITRRDSTMHGIAALRAAHCTLEHLSFMDVEDCSLSSPTTGSSVKLSDDDDDDDDDLGLTLSSAAPEIDDVVDVKEYTD